MKIAPGAVALPEGVDETASSTEEERWVRCAACAARLAPERARVAIDGAHEHEFMNPSALRFVVACFAAAPGCTSEGDPSTVWTWFPGRAWQIALCKACGVHVGWSFHAPEVPPFWGLVRDRVQTDVPSGLRVSIPQCSLGKISRCDLVVARAPELEHPGIRVGTWRRRASGTVSCQLSAKTGAFPSSPRARASSTCRQR